MAHDVFISYSHVDKTIADAICNTLEGDNIRCWYAPRDIEPGQPWAASIINAINASKVMVLIFTEDSNISKQVVREVSNAVSAGLTIIPMKLTNQELSKEMQYYLSTVHWLDAMNCELETAIQNVHNKVQAVLTSDEFIKPQPYREKESDNKAGKKKKIIPIIIAALVILAAIVGIIQFTDIFTNPDVAVATATDATLKISNPDKSYTLGNTQSNMINGGIVASDDHYFYYRSNDNFALYRMRKDGSEQELLLDEQVMYLAAYNGFVYYYSQSGSPYIGRFETKSKKTEVIYTGEIQNMRIYGDRIYFNNKSDKLLLYSISLNGTELKCVSEKENMYDYMIGDECIYYINHDDEDKLYRMSMDGSKYQKMTDCKCQNATICEDYIIYDNRNDETLNAINLKTYDDYIICNGFYANLTITSFGITGVNQYNSHCIVKFGLNKLMIETFVDEDASQCCQLDGFLFYRSDVDGKYHARSMSGGKIISL